MRWKYLPLLPVIILILSVLYFRYAAGQIDDALLRQKALEAENHVEMLAMAAEADPNKYWLDHEKNICASVEFLDNLPLMYAAVYKPIDGAIVRISGRNFETDFDPFKYPEFLYAIQNADRGNLTVGSESGGQGYRDVHLHYRWTPFYSQAESKYLIVTGVSKYTVVTKISEWVSIGQIISIIITFVLNLWGAILICVHKDD